MLSVRPDLLIEIVEISTKGDEDKSTPISQLGTKNVFAHELQAALYDGRIDVAVHSTKDLTSAEPEGLDLAAYLERSDPRDVLVSRSGQTFGELDAGSIIGTSSVRRRALVAMHRPELRTAPLRGNVDTRLRKVADGIVDAAILAGAGIVRLQRTGEITEWLDAVDFIPPPGQGAIVLERRVGDVPWLHGADHPLTRRCVEAERAFMQLIEGSCDVPLGALATEADGEIVCAGFIASPDGERHLRAQERGTDPAAVGSALARRLLGAGAAALVRAE